ncbi:MAG TPA: hypothetical protein VHL80_12980 [Polyangia bacterium]|nr:hypothetical protein [Polyangia bacterium]
MLAVLGCGDIGCEAMPPGCAFPPIWDAAPPGAAGAECHPPFEPGAGPREAAPALAEPGSGLSRPSCPGGGALECQPAGAAAVGDVVGWAPGIDAAVPPP